MCFTLYSKLPIPGVKTGYPPSRPCWVMSLPGLWQSPLHNGYVSQRMCFTFYSKLPISGSHVEWCQYMFTSFNFNTWNWNIVLIAQPKGKHILILANQLMTWKWVFIFWRGQFLSLWLLLRLWASSIENQNGAIFLIYNQLLFHFIIILRSYLSSKRRSTHLIQFRIHWLCTLPSNYSTATCRAFQGCLICCYI